MDNNLDKCEPVAEAIRERDRLGFAVVNVIGKLDEIIENTQEVEIDDFLHIAVPIDMWNELQAALEDMPKRADLYTSPQPIEKCEPVAWQGLGICTFEKPNTNTHLFSPLYARPERVESEPVAWMTKREDVIEQFGTIAISNAHKNSLVLAEQIIADLFDIPLYTSPISKEWVGLSDEQKNYIRYHHPTDLVNATEAKLKQLNTKG